jgi:hypothetical protein
MLSLASALVLFASPVSAAGCINEALRKAQGSTALPGCMALELVSPPKKFTQPAFLPSFSRDGERLVFTAQVALAGTSGYQYFGGDRYIASRGPFGWGTRPTAPPAAMAITRGGARAGNPSIFTPDLARWLQLGGTQQQAQVGIAQLFSGGLDGSFFPLSPLLVPIDDSGSNTPQVALSELEVDGASTDLSTAVLRVSASSTAYRSDDPRGDTAENEPGGDRNSYVAFLAEGGEPSLELLARDKEGVVVGGRCGAHLGGSPVTFNQGAISQGGSRVFFTTRPAQPWDPGIEEKPPCSTANPLRILQRIPTAEGPVISEIAPGGGPAEPGDDFFQAASADGGRVYFTSPRRLTASDTDATADPCSPDLGASKGCDLYLYDSSKPGLIQVSKGLAPADVLSSITAVSGDGSHAYFVAQGVLTGDSNPEGATAQSGQPNLYLYKAETDQLSFLGTLANGDQGGMWGTAGSFFGDAYAAPLYDLGEEDGGDGHVLAFASRAPLTSDDADSGHRDVFRYDATAETLERVSKAATGVEDNGFFDAAVNPAPLEAVEFNFNEAARWMSEDGQVIAFTTAEPLAAGDEDGAANPYVWNAGEVGATFAAIDEPPAVAPFGPQVAFSTEARLLAGQDGDTAKDVYVARADGGFPEPVSPPICDPLVEGSCQGGALPDPPADPPATTAPTFGNVPRSHCKKGFVRRKGKCVKKPRKHKATRRAADRGGGK